MGLNIVHHIIAELRNPKDILASLRPLLFVCFISGIVPFKVVDTSSNRHLLVSIFGFVFIVFHIAWSCTYLMRTFSYLDRDTYVFSSEFSGFGEHIQTIMTLAATGLSVILCVLKHKKLQKIFQTMIQVDRKLIGLGAKINYKQMSKIVWSVLIIQCILLFGLAGATSFLMRSVENSPSFFEWILFLMPVGVILAFKSKYFCIMWLIGSRFSYINITLNQLRMDANEEQLKGFILHGNLNDKMTNRLEKLRVNLKRKEHFVIAELCQTHAELCDVCNLAETYFSHQMLMMVAIEFAFCLFNVYFMIDVAVVKTSIARINLNELYIYLTFSTAIFAGPLLGCISSAASVSEGVCSDV